MSERIQLTPGTFAKLVESVSEVNAEILADGRYVNCGPLLESVIKLVRERAVVFDRAMTTEQACTVVGRAMLQMYQIRAMQAAPLLAPRPVTQIALNGAQNRDTEC